MFNTKIVLTGGAGFIGSHLATSLLMSGSWVTVIDNLSTGRWKNVEHLNTNPRFRLIVASADDMDLLEREVAKHDFVYHLASSVGVKLIIDQPVQTVRNIYKTTDALLSVCSKYRRPIVITSTSEVYGKSDQIPFKEDHDVVMGATSKRRWAYACAKALDEFLALAHHYETNLSVYIVRLFNTVGPRQTGRYGMVLPTLLEQAITGRPLTVYGTGTQTRCFCSVHDVVGGLVALLGRSRAAGTVINLGSEEEVSIMNLARRIKALTQSNSDIVLMPYEEAYGRGFDDMKRRVPDITRASQLLGWKPLKSLDEIIVEMIEFSRRGEDRGPVGEFAETAALSPQRLAMGLR